MSSSPRSARPDRVTPASRSSGSASGLRRGGRTLRAVALACAAAAGAAEATVLTGWTVEKIAGPAQGHYNISGSTAINDAGEVALRAEGLLGPSPHSSQAGLFVWSGGGFRTIGTRVERGGDYSDIAVPGGLSASGVVAFRGAPPGPQSHQGIFAGNGTTTHTLATSGCGVTCEFDQIRFDPAISASGLVAFVATEAPRQQLYVQSASGGPRTLLAFSDPGAASPLSSFLGGISINDAAQVAFRAGLDTGINDVGIFVANASGALAPVAVRGDIAPNGLAFDGNFSRPTINAAGDVVFCATLAGGAAGIFTYHGGTLHTIADSIGTFDGFRFAGFNCSDTSTPSMNDAGMVAFFAGGPAPGDGDDAIFLWDGQMHRLVGHGDEVDGATLTHIRYFGGGINSFGDIAFAADLEGGDPLFIVRAPRAQGVPEPASLALLVLGLCALRSRNRA